MPDPRKESYTECEPCSQAAGESVVYHYTQLEQREPFWGGEAHWVCPQGHKVEAPAIKKPKA